jgi:cell division protein FtsZ
MKSSRIAAIDAVECNGGDDTLSAYNTRNPIKIKVVGLGGGGCNAVTRMVREHIGGVEFVAMNTDRQHLAVTEAPTRITLGERLTHGSGAGGDQDIGRKCAEDSREEIEQVLEGSDMVFLAAGMGGGTGTGAIPVVAEVARQIEALTIAIVTKPFQFEGRRRMEVAEEGIGRLINKVDTLITVSNDHLIALPKQNTAIDNAFKLADEILSCSVQSVTDLITVPGLINIDFARVRNILRNAGLAWISMGRGAGQNPVVDAAQEALHSPLLDVSISTARKALFGVVGGGKMTLSQVNSAAMMIQKAIHPDADIIFGVNIDPGLGDEVRLTLIATGLAILDKPAISGINEKTIPLYERFRQ